MTAHANAPFAVVEIDGREVSVIHRGQCRTCRSTHRPAVERMLVEGCPPSAILDRLPPPAGLTVRNIAEHRRRGHVPTDHETVEAMRAEFRTGPVANLARDATIAEASTIGVATAVLNEVWRRLQGGLLDVTVRDGLRAAKILAAAERASQRLREAEGFEAHRMRAIDTLLRLLRELGGDEFFRAVRSAALRDATLGDVMLDRRLSHHRG